uniref:Uncharacterized protein n=1 Tax=Steinernema glaseri TaxID=37863 RepID=A0A1I7XZE7_9BILA
MGDKLRYTVPWCESVSSELLLSQFRVDPMTALVQSKSQVNGQAAGHSALLTQFLVLYGRSLRATNAVPEVTNKARTLTR